MSLSLGAWPYTGRGVSCLSAYTCRGMPTPCQSYQRRQAGAWLLILSDCLLHSMCCKPRRVPNPVTCEARFCISRVLRGVGAHRCFCWPLTCKEMGGSGSCWLLLALGGQGNMHTWHDQERETSSCTMRPACEGGHYALSPEHRCS